MSIRFFCPFTIFRFFPIIDLFDNNVVARGGVFAASRKQLHKRGFSMNTISNAPGLGALTNGLGALEGARISSEKGKFDSLVGEISAGGKKAGEGLSSSQVSEAGRLNGDWTSGFSGAFSSQADKNALPRGAAANQANPNAKPMTIDRTSKLYEKSMEFENYLVKQMLSEMRKTVMKSGNEDNAKKIYEDMLFDEYSTMMTKNAGFGLADQIYLQLSNGGANDNS